jgi:lipopolysaccharide transport system permease protein
MDTAVLEPLTTPTAKSDSYLKIVPPSGWAALNLRDVWQFRDLLMALAGRDVKLRYKQTSLGVIWVILQPLMGAAIFAFVFDFVAQLPTDGIPALLFTYTGLMAWNLFGSTLSKSSNCLIGNSQLISKIFFPRLVLPFSIIPSVLIDFGVAAAMLVVLMFIYHFPPHLGAFLLPLWLLMLLMMSLGVGLIAAALTVSYRDVAYVLPVFTQFLMYASPIAYSLKSALKHIPTRYQYLYFLNPLVAPLEAFRVSLLGGPWPAMLSMGLIYSALMAVAMLLIGGYSFKKMERKFADVI